MCIIPSLFNLQLEICFKKYLDIYKTILTNASFYMSFLAIQLLFVTKLHNFNYTLSSHHEERHTQYQSYTY